MKIIHLALCLSLAAAGCGKQPETKPDAKPDERSDQVRPVRVQTIDAVVAPRSIEFAGEVRPRYETRLAFRVGGKMTARLVEVGSTVRAGQPVARLDPRDLQLAEASAKSQIAQLEAEKKFAEGDLKRYRDLRAKNFISEAEFERRVSTFDSIDARVNAARAQHTQSANQAGYALLVADTAGVITAIEAEAGQVVAAGQTVARLARIESRGAKAAMDMEVVVAVPESQREAFEKAQNFVVTLNALPGRNWKGKLRELSPAADPVSRTYAAKVTVLAPGEDVELGMSARVSAVVSAAEKRIELPVAAIYGKGDSAQVWLVEGTQDRGAKERVGTVRLQPVKTSGLAGDRVLIASGIAQGDVVVVAGAQLLRAGQRVRIAEAPVQSRSEGTARLPAAAKPAPQ